jgi:hypothetical protein
MKQMEEEDLTQPEQVESTVVEFEPDPTECEFITVNGVEILRPRRVARRQCTLSDILEAIGGDIIPIIPNSDPTMQSTYGDNSRLAKKLGVALSTVYDWRKKYKVVDDAMLQEAERDLDYIENICRSHMLAGDSRATVKWLEAKGRSRGWGREAASAQERKSDLESELNDLIKNQSPRLRLAGIAKLALEGKYDASVKMLEMNALDRK